MCRRHRVFVVVLLSSGAGFLVPQRPVGASRSLSVVATTDSLTELRGWDRQVDEMARSGDLRLRDANRDRLVPGRTHERYDQFYRGVRVWGGDVTRQLDHEIAVSVFGTVYEGLALDLQPRLTPEDARNRVSELAGGVAVGGPLPELVILPLDGDDFALAYRGQAVTPQSAAVYFIDAADGRIRLRYDLFESQAAVVTGTGVLGDTKKVSVTSQSGTYTADDQLRPPSLRTFDLRGNLTNAIDALNGVVALATADLAADPGTAWSDGPNVDAHTYEGYTYDFFFKRFGRRGLDNQDARIVGLTHAVKLEDVFTAPGSVVGLFYLNAFYCPRCGADGKGMMVYGEGLPANVFLRVGSTLVNVNNFAGALDVVAHELTHGVTAFTSRLTGLNESGALNEAFSDMMGTSVEFFIRPEGSGHLMADYLMGQDLVSAPVPGLVRSLRDPASYGTPDHYSERLTGAADNGQVHANSTIASHAFYLAIEGGTNRTSGLAVQGVGSGNREQIEKVFYRGFTSLLPSNATFSIARAATTQAARDLYGTGSAAERAVIQAWTAVGVGAL
jgi:bacillolysin